jgi:hypothetical protein
MGSTYSLPGEPSSYIQVDEVNLQNCLNSQKDIHDCISEHILGPSNGFQVGVNVWTSPTTLPPNPACTVKAAANNGISVSGLSNVQLGKPVNNSSYQNFQNLENFDFSKQKNITMIIVIIITLLVVYFTPSKITNDTIMNKNA